MNLRFAPRANTANDQDMIDRYMKLNGATDCGVRLVLGSKQLRNKRPGLSARASARFEKKSA